MFGRKTKDKEKMAIKKGNGENKVEKDTKKEQKKSKSAEPKEQKIAELSNNILELTATLQKVQAEFENYKKRAEQYSAEQAKFASRDIILKILPILDNFELAINSLGIKDKKTSVVFKDKNAASFVNGIEMIYSQLITILGNEGVKKIEAVGKKFDPYLHEAILQENAKDIKPETVIEELQKGYTMNDKVLRHSKVKVAK